jgi:mono/diheme cytochrome c family protein
MGSPLFFKAVVPIPNWVDVAPPIAGLPSLSEKDAVVLLMTGKLPSGSTLRPPMPAFRFNRADATAIVAYLKSLSRETTKTATAQPHK